jgi:hypothetical protein
MAGNGEEKCPGMYRHVLAVLQKVLGKVRAAGNSYFVGAGVANDEAKAIE